MSHLASDMGRKSNVNSSIVNVLRFFVFSFARIWNVRIQLGVMNGPLNFLTARKIYLCSICSQNLNECSLARAPQIFAIARKLAFLSVLLEIL